MESGNENAATHKQHPSNLGAFSVQTLLGLKIFRKDSLLLLQLSTRWSYSPVKGWHKI